MADATLTNVSPSSGPVGSDVHLSGYDLDAIAVVDMNGTPCALGLEHATSLHLTVPALNPGAKTLRLHWHGTVSVPGGFVRTLA